jgi:putative phosphoribosyl transferase
MAIRFANRQQAGELLAATLNVYTDRPDVLVLALPRGGVPVGFALARALHVPLDILLVRKLGVPGHEELAMGAIASGGVRVLNEDVVQVLAIPDALIERVAAREQREIARREQRYREGRPAPSLAGRSIILVDDGLATGATMRAAAVAVRHQQPARVVIAVPTAAPGSSPPVSVNPIRQQTRHFGELVHGLMARSYSLPVRPASGVHVSSEFVVAQTH